MAGKSDNGVLRVDMELLEQAVAARSMDTANRAVRSLFAHLGARESLEALSAVLVAAADVFAQKEPSLAWARSVARLLPGMDEAAARSHLASDQLQKAHYYTAITRFVAALETALYATMGPLDAADPTERATDATLDVLRAVHGVAWMFRYPDIYARWWASHTWSLYEEGPAPSHVEQMPIDDQCFDEVSGVLSVLIDWLRERQM